MGGHVDKLAGARVNLLMAVGVRQRFVIFWAICRTMVSMGQDRSHGTGLVAPPLLLNNG